MKTKEEIQKYLDSNKIYGNVYLEINFFKPTETEPVFSIRCDNFEVAQNKAGEYELKTTYSNQLIDNKFLADVKILQKLVVKLNANKICNENNLSEPSEMIGRNGKTYFTFENSKSEVVVYDSEMKEVSEEEQERELF